MTGYEGETHPLQPPCPLCGGMTFSWGKLSTNQAVNFEPEDADFIERIFNLGDQVRARLCVGCGNIQLFRRDPTAF